jgi:hypothetical protein
MTIDVEISSITSQPEAECYTKGEEIKVSPDVTLDVGANASLFTITYEVTKPNGTLMTLNQSTFPLDITDYGVSFTLSDLGEYTIKMIVTDLTEEEDYEQSVSIETCNFIDITYVSCDSFSVSNLSSATDVTIRVDSVDGTAVLASQAIKAGETYQLNFTDPSLYYIKVTYGSTTETYVINNFCQVEECIAKFIAGMICDDESRCQPCSDELELNRIFLHYQSYMMKLNKEYGWNNYYNALSDTTLADIASLKNTMDKLKAFCERMDCLKSSTGAYYSGPYTTNTSNCKSCQ